MLKAKNPGRQGLNIIIVGCGKVGSTLIEQLSKEGHDITIIDKNAQKVQEIANLYDIMGVVGNGASYSVQMEGGIENADLIIAVTNSDELNLLCCTIAKQVAIFIIADFFFFVSRRFHGFRFYEPFHFVIEQFRAAANR